jgi:hypothetical protein
MGQILGRWLKMKNRDKRKAKKKKAQSEKAPKKRYRFRLDAFVDGEWQAVDLFKNKEDVDRYVEYVEEIRKKGENRIFKGMIMELKSGKYVKFIEPFDPLKPSTSDWGDIMNVREGM